MMYSKNKAFTLIELLVVIAIIAVIAAILFPVFARAKAAAKQSACLSNIKQIVLAGLMYSGDNDDIVMPAYNGVPPPWMSATAIAAEAGVVEYWTDIIQPYAKSGLVTMAQYQQSQGTGIFNDPAESEQNLSASTCQPRYGAYAWGTSVHGAQGTMNADYAYAESDFGGELTYADWITGASGGYKTSCLSAPNGGTAKNPCMSPPGEWGGLIPQVGRTVSFADTGYDAISRPDETIIANDGFTITVQAGKGWGVAWSNDGYPCSGDQIHNNGGNYGFCDGHAKRIAGDPRTYVTETTSGTAYYYMTYLDINH